MKRTFLQHHKPLGFKFYQNQEDFVVIEEPIKFTQRGNFIILKIKKVNLGTWDLLEKLSKGLNIYEHELGYAGLKDKHATTTQYISIPRKYAKDLKKFKHHKIEIQETFLHSTKLNIGDLKGNTFIITLHETSKEDLIAIQQRLKQIQKVGMPNFFGFQRFGKDFKENLDKARKIIYGELKIRNRKLEKMLISLYQSNLFNQWLSHRIKDSNEQFKLLDGDVMWDIENDKYFTPKTITPSIEEDFKNQKVVPTGLLSGRNVFKSMKEARKIEKQYDDTYIQDKGLRRAAMVFLDNVQVCYDEQKQQCVLQFTLPKAAYATVLIENLQNKNIIVQ
jgi:tRNA pseudouridine13 synthase